MNKAFLFEQFGFLEINGIDAEKFFQGYCTCNLSTLSQNQVMYGATCNLQGRMVSNFLISRTETGLLLRLNKNMAEKLEDFLQKYIVFSKAKLNNATNDIYCIGLLSGHPLFNALSNPNNPETLLQIGQGHIACLPGAPRIELWLRNSAEALNPEIEALTKNCEVDQSEWLTSEIEDTLAWINSTTSEEYLPQMYNLHQMSAIDFEKGCYLGQEIVARMHFRGKLKKTLHKGSASRLVMIGERVFDSAQKDIGEIVVAAQQQMLAVIQTKSSADGVYQLSDKTSLELTNLEPQV